jgi:FPC/CPF motif-containing protein YcgG
VSRTAQTFPPGGLWDRQGQHWLVADVDGTKQAARQRALPKLGELPAAHRRFEGVCAPGYLGRKRGEAARTRTMVLQAHSHQWLGTFGGPGNGNYRAELDRACQALISYAGGLCLPLTPILIRLDPAPRYV